MDVKTADPAAWLGPDMAASDDWLYTFSDHDIAEIDAAVDAAGNIDLKDVTKADFPLAGLGPVLAGIQNDVVHGRGFVMLRGLPVDRWTPAESALAYWGIGCHFGDPVSQNAQGHLLGHVRDVGKDPGDPVTRIYQTAYLQPYHTDSSDIVGLLCLQKSKSGGASRIVSSTAIYHEMERRHPDLLAVLEQPFIIDRKNEVPEGMGPHYAIPLFYRHGGVRTVFYVRDFIEAALRFDEVPELTAAHTDALDAVDAIAADPAFHLEMAFEPGDIQFLHNHQILHARTTYEDFPEPERRRHLLRLWLSTPNGRELPPAFANRYGEIAVGKRRGGIHVPGVALSAPVNVA
jgi:hypothetical protein